MRHSMWKISKIAVVTQGKSLVYYVGAYESLTLSHVVVATLALLRAPMMPTRW